MVVAQKSVRKTVSDRISTSRLRGLMGPIACASLLGLFSSTGCVISAVDVPVEDRYAKPTVVKEQERDLVIEDRTFPDPAFQAHRARPSAISDYQTITPLSEQQPIQIEARRFPRISPVVKSTIVYSSQSSQVDKPFRSISEVVSKPKQEASFDSVTEYSATELSMEPMTSRVKNSVKDMTIFRNDSTLPSESTENRHYAVQPGDTLFSIAWRLNLDLKALAKRNKLDAPYTIYPGQRLILLSSVKDASQPGNFRNLAKKNSPENSVLEPGYKKRDVNNKLVQKKGGKNQLNAVNLYWVWPADGKIISTFRAPTHDAKGADVSQINKGVDIEGKSGQPVLAAADGKVVYSGEGLLGYGRLIIIKHNNIFLSAYGHNKRLLVNEGDVVKAGDKIAEIGSTGASQEKLHFEIRKEGKPVDPLRYLPSRASRSLGH